MRAVKYILPIILMILSISYIHAQKELYNWPFTRGIGLSFLPDGKSPHVIDGFSVLYPCEGTASISDKDGNLLFYTNGHDLYNRKHIIMHNAEGIKGSRSSAMSSMIIKQPFSDSIYYLFTTGHNYGYNHNGDPTNPTWYYNIIDMSLDDGLGGVKKKILYSQKICQRYSMQ